MHIAVEVHSRAVYADDARASLDESSCRRRCQHRWRIEVLRRVEMRFGPSSGNENPLSDLEGKIISFNSRARPLIRDLHHLVCAYQAGQIELVHTCASGDEVHRGVEVGAEVA